MIAPIDIRRVGVVSPMAIGFDAFGIALGAGRTVQPIEVPVSGFAGEALPPRAAIWLKGFDPVEYLGRKGISTLDRITQLSIVACKQIVDDGDADSQGTGLVLGSRGGGLKSISDFIRSTYASDIPYHVSPLLFPNSVMNSVASQCAIWFGMRGINATICAGELSGLAALSYASRMLRMEHVQKVIAGSAEELCGFNAWSHHALFPPGAPPIGEGAALFELQPADASSSTAKHAQLLAIRLRNSSDILADAAFGSHVRAMLEAAQVSADSVRWWSHHRSPVTLDAPLPVSAIRKAGLSAENMVPVAHDLTERIGFTGAASTSFQVAAAIATAPRGIGLVTAISAEGQIGCALIRIPEPPSRPH